MNMDVSNKLVQGSELITLQLPKKIVGGRLSELLERIPYISEAVKSVQYVEFEHAASIEVSNSRGLNNGEIHRDLHELVNALLESKILPQKTLRVHPRPDSCTTLVNKDPSESYYSKFDIQFMESVDRLLVKIATRHGAVMRDYASIYSAEVMHRNGYHKNFPQNVYGVTHIPHNYTLIKEIRESSSSTIPSHLFESQGAFLQPCVCYHCYAEIQQTKQNSAVFSMKGRCFRHEIQWRLNQFRRNEFTMREIVFLGDAEFVEKKRLAIMDETWELFCSLGLYGQIVTARDPFFHYDDMKTKGAVQLMADAKYELEFASSTGNSSSIASFNNCQDTLCNKFEITDMDNRALHSGCVAFGIDRWRAALFEQYGANEENWPSLLRKA